ncbi:MAG: DUF4349 domain-containing protein [Brevinema sp.]
MKNIALMAVLSLLTSCITINYGGAAPSPTPRMFMSKQAASPAMAGDMMMDGASMAYRASATVSSFKPQKVRDGIISNVQLFNGEILQDGNEILVMRVPSENLTNMVESLEKLGKVESVQFRGDNIAQPMEDGASRLENLLAAREQYQSILQQSKQVQDILTANREIEQLNYQIQALQNQQRDYELQTKFSQLTVTIKKRETFGPLGWVLYGVWVAVKWFFWWG